MDKLTMAHEYALKQMESLSENSTMQSLVSVAWQYADAMQAEANKRNNKETCDKNIGLDSSVLKPSNSIELEWQPDWSQAPDNCHFFCVASNDGYGFFNNIKPELMGDYFYVGCGALMIEDHGYQGNWQESLRKRPQ